MSEELYDVVIYGGTAAGIIAAVQAARMDRRAIVIEPTRRVGGMTTCGLSDTDAGNELAVGGLALEFYQRVGEKYGKAEPEWMFEPKVALEVLHEFAQEHGFVILRNERLAATGAVQKEGAKIVSPNWSRGKRWGAMFWTPAIRAIFSERRVCLTSSAARPMRSIVKRKTASAQKRNCRPGLIRIKWWVIRSSGLLARVNPDARARPVRRTASCRRTISACA